MLGASHREAVNALRAVQDVLTIMVCDGFELADGEELPITPGLPKSFTMQPPESAKTTTSSTASPRASQRMPPTVSAASAPQPSASAADVRKNSLITAAGLPPNGKVSGDPIAERFERERQHWQEQMARQRQEFEDEEKRRKERRQQGEQLMQREILERVSQDRRRREQALEEQRRSSKPFGNGGDRVSLTSAVWLLTLLVEVLELSLVRMISTVRGTNWRMFVLLLL